MPPAFDPSGGSLVFLVSQPRAGSTLLQRLLAAHPEVETGSEPWLMLHPLYALRPSGWRAEYGEDWARQGLEDFLARYGGAELYREAMRASAAVLYGAALQKSGRRLYLDKTPRYYHVLPELRELFPRARFVFLLRHPLGVLASILKSWAGPDGSLLPFHDDLHVAPARIASAIADLGQDAAVVRYEELVTRPQTALTALCAKLGLAFSPAILEYGDDPGGRLGDRAGTALHRRPSAESLDRWHRLADDPRSRDAALRYLDALGPALLGELGYPIEEARDALGGSAELRVPVTATREEAPPPVWLPRPARRAPPTPRNGSAWPRISIVTPSLGQAPYLEETIQSVLSQGYPDLEYVIVDGGSTDGSVEIIRRYEPWLKAWTSAPDGGQYDAINRGFANTTGEVMGWLNASDLHCPWALETVAEIFSDCPEVDWLTSSSLLVWNAAGRGAEIQESRGYARTWFDRGAHLSGRAAFTHFVQQEATFWRRSLWEKAGGRVDAGLRYAGDFELWARFFRHADLATTSWPLAGFRRHPGQKTEDMRPYETEAEAVLQRYRHPLVRHRGAVWLSANVVRLTRHGGRLLGSRRTWVRYVPGLGRWVSGWEYVV